MIGPDSIGTMVSGAGGDSPSAWCWFGLLRILEGETEDDFVRRVYAIKAGGKRVGDIGSV